MGRTRQSIKEQCDKVKELYCKGYTVKEIATAIGMSKESVYNSFTIMGMSLKKSAIDEKNLVYADNSVEFEKVVIYGNWLYKNGKKYRVNRLCTDITPMFAPR